MTENILPGYRRDCRLGHHRTAFFVQRHVQLVINTGTTIITFLMVFLIQNTQNRDTEAIQIKLDELIRATKGAHNALLDLEELEEDALDCFRNRYEALAAAARRELDLGSMDTGTPEP
jgi:low affinity Fe/Cu permease